VPRIAFGIVACPIAAVLGDELFEPVAGALGEPQRGLVSGLDLQPDPGDGELAMGPARRGAHGTRAGTLAALFWPHPVRQSGRTQYASSMLPGRSGISPTAPSSRWPAMMPSEN
jgi:hypothetical protein